MNTLNLPEVLGRVAKLPTTEFEMAGNTVREILDQVCTEHNQLREHLFYDNGEIKGHFLLSVDGEIAEVDSAIKGKNTIDLMLAASGGLDLAQQTQELNRDEVQRYARHLTLPNVGRRGQMRLKAARVLLIGTGGLGAPVSMYLAAAGVGTLGLVDFDTVEASNLQRQIVHGTSTVGQLKVESAKKRLLDINDSIQVETYATALNADNALEIISQYDLVIDGSDNFSTRYLVNDACVMAGKPLVYGAIYQFDGQNSVFNYDGGPCYRCLFPQQPPAALAPNCSAGGVIGVLPGVIGMIQATEAVKAIIGLGETLSGRLMTFDALSMKFSEIRFSKRKNCAVCSEHPTITSLEEEAQTCSSVSSIIDLDEQCFVSPEFLKGILDDGHQVDYTLLDVRDAEELEICVLPEAQNIPLNHLEDQFKDLDTERDYFVTCYSGGRAKAAVKLLRDNGFNNSFVVDGGMKKWVKNIDPEMPIY
ncbi:molybdopterin-synthase adenylyltransferase MoeB [Parendozoicomonas sp. Alg238-R29]|uniref:molybdopterin-synthase adenylyltransferase MoeB n=1 Tax=Parendozoicomonas sp. Alg238-R29 TaxID=2993446 RepID=UPI00248E30C2|nr:molybdopterin-synthase adenylyltransferase MoeB [Parendozoicomonas sp. Alg238-R29]